LLNKVIEDGGNLRVEKFVLDYLSINQSTKVRDLISVIHGSDASWTSEMLICLLTKMEKDRKVSLKHTYRGSFRSYLLVPYWNMGLYFVSLLLGLNLLAIYIVPVSYPWSQVRIASGLLFLLFLPGYATIQAVLPSRFEIDRLETIAMSFGLSLAVELILGLILNFSSLGFRLNSVVIFVSCLTMSFVVLAAFRKYRSYFMTSLV